MSAAKTYISRWIRSGALFPADSAAMLSISEYGLLSLECANSYLVELQSVVRDVFYEGILWAFILLEACVAFYMALLLGDKPDADAARREERSRRATAREALPDSEADVSLI